MMINLYNNDARNINVMADCVITDPPYKLTSGGGNGSHLGGCLAKGKYSNDGCIVTCDISWDEIFYVVSHGLPKSGEAYVMANNRNLSDAEYASRRAGFKLHNILVWNKGTVTANTNGMNRCEYCLYLFRGRTRNWNDMGASQVFNVPDFYNDEGCLFNVKNNDKGCGHPTQKPVALMEAWIRLATDKGQTVYDPFMGVASTGVGCVRNELNFIGCELEKKWFDIAEERIMFEQKNKQTSLFA